MEEDEEKEEAVEWIARITVDLCRTTARKAGGEKKHVILGLFSFNSGHNHASLSQLSVTVKPRYSAPDILPKEHINFGALKEISS